MEKRGFTRSSLPARALLVLSLLLQLASGQPSECTSFVAPLLASATPVVATPATVFLYAQTVNCPTSCNGHCEAGCLMCSVRHLCEYRLFAFVLLRERAA